MANLLTTLPFVKPQYFDDDGNPLSGGQLFFYAAGTSTKQNVYTDASGSVAQSNPVVLDDAGRPSSQIFMQPLTYKIVAAPSGDTDPPTSPYWTVDNVSANSPFNVDLDVTGTSGEAIAVNDCVYLSDGSGGRTAGTWYKADADFDYASTLARVIGFAMTAAGGASVSFTIRRGGRVTGLSGLTAGTPYYVSATAGALTASLLTSPRRVGQADTTTSLIIAAEIPEALIGFIDIPLASWRLIAANDIPNTAANGGLLDSTTAPSLIRINAATDKGLRILWAAGSSIEITASFTYPNDIDDSAPLIVNLLASMSGATNTPTVQVDYFEGLGDTNAGGATGAVTGTTITKYTRTIAASDIGPAPTFASISLTPGAHATDLVRLYAVYLTYTKKLKSS